MFHRQQHIDAAAAKGLEIADLLAVVVDDPHLPAHFTAKGPALSGGDLVDLSGVSHPLGGKHLGRLGIGAVGGRGRGKGHTGLLSAYRLRAEAKAGGADSIAMIARTALMPPGLIADKAQESHRDQGA